MIPKAVVRKLDQVVGPRRRSKFVVAAIIERLNRVRLQQIASQVADSLRDTYIPEWDTDEKTSVWVRRDHREADDTQTRSD